MYIVSSTDMRKDFGRHIDTIVRNKPLFIKRSRDYFMGISIEMARELVKDIKFHANKFVESDGTITLSLRDFDIVINEETKEKALAILIRDLRDYATDYYEEIDFWSSDPNRKKQVSSILKVLLYDEDCRLKEDIICHGGKS